MHILVSIAREASGLEVKWKWNPRDTWRGRHTKSIEMLIINCYMSTLGSLEIENMVNSREKAPL